MKRDSKQITAERKQARRLALGRAVRRKRESVKLTQEDVARLLCWSRPKVVAIERGQQATTVDQVYELADLLDYDIGDFLQYDLVVEADKLRRHDGATSPSIIVVGGGVIEDATRTPASSGKSRPPRPQLKPSPAKTRAKTKAVKKNKDRKVKSK